MSEYRPLDTETVRDFASPFLPGPAESAEEVGDGNLNLVFRVKGGGGSVVVKQALPYMRLVGEGWPLPLDRARIEAAALELEDRLAPGRVPKLHHYDADLYAMVMEDLSDHLVMRYGMIAQEDYPLAARHLAAFAAKNLLGTSHLLVPAGERKALALRFHNPELCAITEDLIFTSPYIESASNRIEPGMEAHAARLRENAAARREAARLRFAFKTRAEAIVHGDLHTGSVMATPSDTRVIDPEFAFPGPMAFDTGKLIGNFALSYISHVTQGHEAYATRVAGWADEFWTAFVDEVRRLWPSSEPWREAFLAELLGESARYAGAVMCRRTVGLAGVSDIRGIEDAPLRLAAQQRALAGGTALLTSRTVGAFADLWELATGTPAYA